MALRLNRAIFVDANRRFENALSVLPWNIRIFGQIMLNHSWCRTFAAAVKVYDTVRVHPICEPSKQLDCEVQKSMALLQLGRPIEAAWRQRKQLLKSTMNPLTTDRSKPSLLCIRKPSLVAESLAGGPYRS